VAATIDPHGGLHLSFHGYTVLLTEPDGTIDGDGLGLFDYDTRILSTYRIIVDDEAPRYCTSAAIESDDWAAHLIVARPGADRPQQQHVAHRGSAAPGARR
jgi:hypothetical protein